MKHLDLELPLKHCLRESMGWVDIFALAEFLGEGNIFVAPEIILKALRKLYREGIIEHRREEDIPLINAFVFDRFGKCSSYVCENIFGCDEGQQPSPRQIVEHAKKIATYPNWNKVLEVFRNEAFQD